MSDLTREQVEEWLRLAERLSGAPGSYEKLAAVCRAMLTAWDQRDRAVRAVTSHLCPEDAADWLACTGEHGEPSKRGCAVCEAVEYETEASECGRIAGENADLKAKLAAAEAALPRWREMDSAPRDGSEVLIRTGIGVVSARYDNSTTDEGPLDQWVCYDDLFTVDEPQAWMPCREVSGEQARDERDGTGIPAPDLP